MRDAVFPSYLPGDVVWLACDKCGRNGRYRIAGLIKQHGANASLIYLRPTIAKRRKSWQAPQRLRSLRGPLGERNDGARVLIDHSRISPGQLFALPAILLGAAIERGSSSLQSPRPVGDIQARDSAGTPEMIADLPKDAMLIADKRCDTNALREALAQRGA